MSSATSTPNDLIGPKVVYVGLGFRDQKLQPLKYLTCSLALVALMHYLRHGRQWQALTMLQIHPSSDRERDHADPEGS